MGQQLPNSELLFRNAFFRQILTVMIGRRDGKNLDARDEWDSFASAAASRQSALEIGQSRRKWKKEKIIAYISA